MADPSVNLIAQRAADVLGRIREAERASGRPCGSVRLVAVSKLKPSGDMIKAWECGITEFGENYVQEAMLKSPLLPQGALLHMVGSLQKNKAKKAVQAFSLIQSVDSVRLASALDRAACELGRIADVLLEVNLGMEESKGGVEPDMLRSLAEEVCGLTNVNLRGLMVIPPADCPDRYFDEAKRLFDDLGGQMPGGSGFDTLSMGMSSDFEKAIKYGSTMVRIGRAIFGER